MKKLVFLALTLTFMSKLTFVYGSMADEKNSLYNTNQTTRNQHSTNINRTRGFNTTANPTIENNRTSRSMNSSDNTSREWSNIDNVRRSIPDNITLNRGKTGTDYSRLNNTNYGTFRGKVQNSRYNRTNIDGNYVTLSNQFGQNVRFALDDNTRLTGVDEFGYNKDFVVVYDPNRLEGENQFRALAVTGDIANSNIALSSFDDEFISRNRDLSLGLNDRTSVLAADGTPYSGDLENRNLLVFYDNDNASRSANTRKIVVYDGRMEKNSGTIAMQNNSSANDSSNSRTIRSSGSIAMRNNGSANNSSNAVRSRSRGITNNSGNTAGTQTGKTTRSSNFGKALTRQYGSTKQLAVGDMFHTENGITMVSLEDVLRSVNMNMYYDRQTKTVGINNEFHFMLGHPSVTVDGKTHLLNANPIERSGRVYVPIDFFAKAFNLSVHERNGSLVINAL